MGSFSVCSVLCGVGVFVGALQAVMTVVIARIPVINTGTWVYPFLRNLLVGFVSGNFSELIQVGCQLRIITIGVYIEVGVAGV